MNLLLSFSGGETSAYMTKYMLDTHSRKYENVRVVFANTGQEDERTLEFVDRCDREFGFNVTWVEAVINSGRVGMSFKLVDYKTASRGGQPFEDMIIKYGIPNKAYPHCTRELKLAPITAYLRSIGWKKGAYETAIGIRSDELDRVSSKMASENIVYPLIELIKVDKAGIKSFWGQQTFRLELAEHEGNCTWCWKKSKRKLLTLASDRPEIFEFPARMELAYGLNGSNKDGTRRVFFRGNTSTTDVLAEAKLPFSRFSENLPRAELSADMDHANGCSESCEVL